MTIDAHQHFWIYSKEKHAWINDEMSVIRRDFLPRDLELVLKQNNVDACVAVQADESENETDFLIDLAQQHPFIKAVVGWVDLSVENISERLAHYRQKNIVKGFRHILQAREPSYMLQPSFLNGIAALSKYSFTYDILVFPNHLEAAIELVRRNPNQLFVVDHIAKPYIRAGLINEWKSHMKLLAGFDNVYCKLSGMVTEANFHCWHHDEFTPYLDVVTEAFGTKRMLFGSDWPVCLVAATYHAMKKIVDDYFAAFSPAERAGIFGLNAAGFYNIEQ